MDRFGHSAPSVDELKQILSEANSSNSLKNLRMHFERVQELRRIHSGDFDLQLLIAETQEVIIQRARDLRSRPGSIATDNGIPPLAKVPAREHGAEDPAELADTTRTSPQTESGESNSKSWRRATILALLLTAVICVVFFYLIQAARKINLQPAAPAPAQAKTPEPAKSSTQTIDATATAPVPSVPTVRLYTDLVPGTVSVDDGEPQDLKDGELVLDHLEPGRHSIKVTGRSGTAAFSFDVAGNNAPQAIPPVSATNAIAVLVSAQDGKGRLITNLGQTDVSLDGARVGTTTPDGLAFDNLGTTDHEVQIGQGKDRQRFVMTYTPAPVLTAYVKSDFNAGTVTIDVKQDGVLIYIDDKLYRRKTDHGQLRIPLKVGQFVIRVHKDGFVDPAPQSVDVKKGEESEVSFRLDPLPTLASLQIRGGTPGAAIYIDKEQAGTVGPEGTATVSGVKTGEHTVELRMEGSTPKKFDRVFQAGQPVSITGPDAALEKASPLRETPEPPPPVANTAPPTDHAVDIPGEQVRKGGGFVHYTVPHSAGRYSFQAHSKIGGFLKHDKLQWYAGYQDSENYVMFSVDGKHATIREMIDGKSSEIARVPFKTGSDEWIQVEFGVKPGSIDARVKTAENGWQNLGVVSSHGRDFTQGKVGFYLPGNDEIAVSNFRFTSH